MDSNRFQILSMDGGGIKGLFSAYLLQKIEEDFAVELAAHFDLIVGTSTGGIIAIGLGLGRKPREIVDLYTNLGQRIFPGPRWWRNTVRWFRAPYAPGPLEAELKKCFGDRTLGASTKRLVIPSYDLGQREVKMFKTAHLSRIVRDPSIPAWKVAMATTAAPTYFPAHRDVEDRRLIDGGIWANNPIMVGVVEAVAALNVPREAIRVLSVGTTSETIYPSDRLDRGGKLLWAKAAPEEAFQGQASGALGQAQLLVGKERILRLNLPAPKGLHSLDRAVPERLKAAAAFLSQHEGPHIKQMFLDHIAPEFSPEK
mgnify:CR=1 FL=1